jgi:hypothetical protein
MSRTSAHFRSSTAAGRRRVLPVRAWLHAGAAAAAVGFALAGAATASADDGTAARDSSAARNSSTESRVSASVSAPRAAEVQVGSRVAQSPVSRPPITAPSSVGKALFNSSGKVAQTPRIYFGQNRDEYLAIDDPALALWSNPQTKLRTPTATKYAVQEWLRGASFNANPDVWVKDTLKGVRGRLDTSPLGVFTPAFPTVKNPGIQRDGKLLPDPGNNGDGVSVTRYFGTIKGGEATPRPFGDRPDAAYLGLLNALATITPQNSAECAKKRCNRIQLSGGNDVVMPGWIGNAVINSGAGDDIILASPQVNVVVNFSDRTFYAGLKPSARVYYPTPYALKGTASNNLGNIFSGAAGNDVIYYDGSVAEAYGGDGDDILAPSFGSFNWAFDTLIQGTFTETAATRALKNPVSGFGPRLRVYRDATDRPNAKLELLEGIALVSGTKALLGPDTNLRRGLNQTPNNTRNDCTKDCVDSYNFENFINGEPVRNPAVLPFNIGLNGDPASGKPKIDKEINKLGGQDLYGGAGDDIIYGIDPDFYRGFNTAANGQGIRLAFNNPGQDGTVDGRQYAQVFQSVDMFGGTGGDYFALGNPRNLDPARLDGRSLYRISGNSDSFKSKNTSDFGVLEGDVFEVNLTYEGANWTSSVASPGGASDSPAKLVKAGADAIKVVNDLSKFGALAAIAMPKFAAVAGLVSFVAGLVDGFQPEPEKSIEEGPFYSDPIGKWRTTIEIQDWDPADSITLHVDPSNSQSDPGTRWDNVQFGLDPNPTSDNAGALTITAQLSGESTSRPLIVLEQFTAKENVEGAWWAWDFRQAGGEGAYVPITKDHLSFFGQVDPSKASVAEAYNDQYDFPVAQGSPLFRWNDPALKNAGLLDTLRSNSERIVIQLDTMSLGYYWDIHYLGEASGPDSPITNPRVDEKASKLWVVNPDAGAAVEDRWIGYSLEDLAANPELAKKGNPVWIGPRVNPNDAAT